MFKITVNFNMVVGGNKTNFPLLFSQDVNNIPSSFWSEVSDANGLDIRFYSDTAKSIEYKREIVNFDSGTKKVESWIQIPLLSSSVNTVIFCEVDAGTKSNDTDVWDDISSYTYHWNGNADDSSANINNGVVFGCTEVTGKFGGKGYLFDGVDDRIEISNIDFDVNNVSFETWIKLKSNPPVSPLGYGNIVTIFGRSQFCNNTRGWRSFSTIVKDTGLIGEMNGHTTNCSTGSNHERWDSDNTELPLNTWKHIVITSEDHDTTVRVIRMYVDGQLVASTKNDPGPIGVVGGVNDKTLFGAVWRYVGSSYVEHTHIELEESRIYINNLLGANWIETDYNNQNAQEIYFNCTALISETTAINYAIEIKTDGAFTDADIGHTNDGYFRWITGRPGYNGSPTYPLWPDDTNNTEAWYEGLLIKDSLSSPSSQIDIKQSGRYGTVSSFSFKVENTNKIWDILETESVFLPNKEVQVYAIIGNKFYYAWSGVIDNDPYTESEFIIKCSSNYRTIHKNFPLDQITIPIYPLAKKEDVGKPIPVCLGNINYAKMFGISIDNEKIVLDILPDGRNQDGSLNDNSIKQQKRDQFMYAVPAKNYSPGATLIYIDLIVFSVDVGTNEWAGKYLAMEAGEGIEENKYYRILENTENQPDNTIRVTLESTIDELDTGAADYFNNNYAVNVINPAVTEKTWWFNIIGGESEYIVSNKLVGGIQESIYGNKLIYNWNEDEQKYKNISPLINGIISQSDRDVINLLDANTALDFINIFYSRALYIVYGKPSTNQENFEKASDKDRSTLTDDLVLMRPLTLPLLEMDINDTYDNPYTPTLFLVDFDFINIEDDILQNIEKLYIGLDAEVSFMNTENSETTFNGFGFNVEFYDLYGNIMPSVTHEFRGHLVGYFGTKDVPVALDFNFLPNEFYKNGNDNDESSLFGTFESYDSSIGSLIKNEMKLGDTILDLIKRKIIKYARLQFRFYQTALNVGTQAIAVKLKQIGVFSRGTVDTTDRNFYTRIEGGEAYDLTNNTESVFNTYRHLLENYNKIPSANIDYTTLDVDRGVNIETNTGWDLGRQIVETKNSLLYLDELSRQSFVGIYQTIDNKLRLKAFNEDIYEDGGTDETVETFTDDTNILRNSIKNFSKTPITSTFNEFFIKYQWNQNKQDFDKEITITHTDEDSFPDQYEGTEPGSNTIITDTNPIDNITLYSFGKSVITFDNDVTGSLSIGDIVSIQGSGGSSGTLQFGVLSAILGTKTIFVKKSKSLIESINIKEDYPNGVVIKHILDSLPKWKTYVSGINSYSTAKAYWEACHNSYLKSGVIKRAPASLTECKWYIDASEFNEKIFFKVQGESSSPYFLLQNLIEWTVFQKNIVTFSVPLDDNYINRDLLDFCLFKDVILTNNEHKAGWIVKRKINTKNDSIEFTMILRPTPLSEFIVVRETGSAPDTIDETGSQPDQIQEG